MNRLITQQLFWIFWMPLKNDSTECITKLRSKFKAKITVNVNFAVAFSDNCKVDVCIFFNL